jgi:hypothetical protein
MSETEPEPEWPDPAADPEEEPDEPWARPDASVREEE